MTEEATNSEEFSSEDETSLPESAEQSETQEVEATEAEAEEEDKPRKPTAKDRIDELTRLRREAERDAEYWKAKALAEPKPAEAPKTAQPAAEAPNPDSYDAGEFDTRYIKDLARWEAKQEVAQAIAALNAEQSKATAETEWKSRIAQAAETMPDFEEKVILGAQRNDWACSQTMADALRESGKGPEIAYHLASEPAEAARISRLSPALQLMELGKLEAKLTAPKSNAVTKAPQPGPQARGSAGRFSVQPDTNDFAAFDKTYGG